MLLATAAGGLQPFPAELRPREGKGKARYRETALGQTCRLPKAQPGAGWGRSRSLPLVLVYRQPMQLRSLGPPLSSALRGGKGSPAITSVSVLRLAAAAPFQTPSSETRFQFVRPRGLPPLRCAASFVSGQRSRGDTVRGLTGR